ncbi:hypothetical protein F66182_8180 [Fusarium sp. NRRL 66182]|nr:hypothetical protein F66182_8180 [Fusarium sp. NRRL 66182]
MSDFSQYGVVSPEWLKVVDERPPPDPSAGLKEMQQIVNKAREELSARDMRSLGIPVPVHMQDYAVPARDGTTLKVRTYRPISAEKTTRLPIYIHLHGGGYVFGNIASEDAICTRIAVGSSVTVVNLDYRHTPDFAYPTAWHDTEDVFHWVHDHIQELLGSPDQVVVGGISAGAQLAAALALRQNLSPDALSRPKLAGQILMIPALVHPACYAPQLELLKDPSLSSYVQNEDAPLITKKAIEHFIALLKVENPDPHDLLLNAGNASSSEVKGLPPTVFGIAGLDPLRDEGLFYAKKLAEAG